MLTKAKPKECDRAAAPFEFHQDNWGRWVFTGADGRTHVGVEPVRSFPISDPEHGISICDADGKELVWLASLADLPPAARAGVEQALASREFVPVLRRIVRVHGHVEPVDWDVETDRGATRIRIPSEESVRRLPGDRAMITDANGLTYLVPKLSMLDGGTAHILERYL